MYSGYLKFSGIELGNHARYQAYMDGGLGQGIEVYGDFLTCPTLTPLFDDPGPYVLPNLDPAPWYDASRPESAHVAGIVVESVEGLDSPYVPRDVQTGIIGGSLGGLRLGQRVIPIRVAIFALSEMGANYALEWLTALLSGRFCNASTFCNLGDLEYFAACPSATRGSECSGAVPIIDETALDLNRTMYSGGLQGGPTILSRQISKRRRVIGYLVEFVVAMESPYIVGSTTFTASAVDLTANGAVASEVYDCPEFVDPCAGLGTSTQNDTACVTFVEQTCDWNNGNEQGPSSWLGFTWTPTGEEVLASDPGVPCTMSITRTGDAGIDGCVRPSVRMLFGDAAGGSGPISIELDLDAGQGNLNLALWNPATNTNIPIASVEKPNGSGARTFSEPTGDAVNILSTLGHYKINYSLPAGVDPGTLYLIAHAFGGSSGGIGGTPVDETMSGIFMNYVGGGGASACCNLEPGVPIVASTFQVPCWADPASSHRTVTSLANPSLVTEQGMKFAFSNTDAAALQNLRVAIYDPTLIGLAASAVPTAGGTWPSGVEEWECNALVAEFYVPEIPALSTLEADGCRRQVLLYPNGSPGEAVSGDRYFYGGPEKPWLFQSIPPCTTYAVVVFADEAATVSGTVDIGTADLHLIDGASS